MSETLLKQLDQLATEVEDVAAVMEKSESFRAFNKWVQDRHVDSNIVCEINRYQQILSVDTTGTVIKADNLLQIRYVDENARKKNRP